MTYVIVGGPHDGRRINLTERSQQVVLACFADLHYCGLTATYEGAFSEGYGLTNTEMYELTELRTQLFRYTFYRYHKLTVDQAIGALINGYHNNPTE